MHLSRFDFAGYGVVTKCHAIYETELVQGILADFFSLTFSSLVQTNVRPCKRHWLLHLLHLLKTCTREFFSRPQLPCSECMLPCTIIQQHTRADATLQMLHTLHNTRLPLTVPKIEQAHWLCTTLKEIKIKTLEPRTLCLHYRRQICSFRLQWIRAVARKQNPFFFFHFRTKWEHLHKQNWFG